MNKEQNLINQATTNIFSKNQKPIVNIGIDELAKHKEEIESKNNANSEHKANINSNPEMVNHPSHYNNYDVEVIDMMVDIWGTEAVINFCKLNAFKYRMRMGTKNIKKLITEHQPVKSIQSTDIASLYGPLIEDFEKEQWYLNKADELSKLIKK